MLEYFPFRHIDKTQITPIGAIDPRTDYVQVLGKVVSVETLGQKTGKRLVATLRDDTGEIELVWFQVTKWIETTLQIGAKFRVFGKDGFFMNTHQIRHHEREMVKEVKVDVA